MKKFLATAAMAAAMAMPGVAHADNIAFEGQRPTQIGGFNIPNSTTVYSTQLGYNIGLLGDNSVGYTQSGTNAGNIDTANAQVTNKWLIKGTVTRDCSYYGGAGTSHTLDFGTIGVNTQAATSVNNAFDMVSAANATVTSTTAGCNFNNKVIITKANGSQGLLNTAAGGYDGNNFQANIPYSVGATFVAGGQGSTAGAASQTLNVGSGVGSNTGFYGAWRSAMTLNISAPVPGKALVAGDYSDTLTVELNAL